MPCHTTRGEEVPFAPVGPGTSTHEVYWPQITAPLVGPLPGSTALCRGWKDPFVGRVSAVEQFTFVRNGLVRHSLFTYLV